MRDDVSKDRDAQPAKPRGPHPDRRLTPLRVRHATRGRYADGNGLYLFVDESGAKRWLLRTIVHGKRRDIGLGSTRLISLPEARTEAARLRRIARDGGDPLAERRKARTIVPTLKDAAAIVHASHSRTFRNTKHQADWLNSLQLHVFPLLGNRLVDSITPADVLQVLGPIWLTKPETARRVQQRLRAVFDWAKLSGFRDKDNPATGIKGGLPKHKSGKAHHAALPYDQVPAFMSELRATAAGESTRLAFEFLILTAARTSEVIGAQWNEIDVASRTWTVPANRIKSGREHRVPLSARCIELLEQARALSSGDPYVFSGRSSKRPLSNTVFLMLLRRMGYGQFTGHGFRSAFRDWAAERTNVPRAVCEAALAHVVKDRTEAAYLRTDLFDLRRSLMDTWTAFATTSGTVVRIRA